MKFLLCFPLFSAALAVAAEPTGYLAAQNAVVDFQDHLGLQLWSLRVQLAENFDKALDQAKAYGIKEVEVAGTGKTPVAKIAADLEARGLVPIGEHIGYEQLKRDLPGVIRDAHTLGVKYVVCPILPFKTSEFDVAAAKKVAAEFNTWGAALEAAGIHFGYHTHGIEFRPTGGPDDENSFDVLVRETKPELVTFEMDVLWVVHAGQNPIRLFRKYPNRWSLLHLKDLRLGAESGLAAPHAGPADKVAVGLGQIDWPSVLAAAEAVGVKHFFIEDECAEPLKTIPLSLAYLRSLK